MQDLLDMVDIEKALDDCINFVDEVIKKKESVHIDMDVGSDVDDEEYEVVKLIQE